MGCSCEEFYYCSACIGIRLLPADLVDYYEEEGFTIIQFKNKDVVVNLDVARFITTQTVKFNGGKVDYEEDGTPIYSEYRTKDTIIDIRKLYIITVAGNRHLASSIGMSSCSNIAFIIESKFNAIFYNIVLRLITQRGMRKIKAFSNNKDATEWLRVNKCENQKLRERDYKIEDDKNMNKLSKRSEGRLEGVAPIIIKGLKEFIGDSPYDFGIPPLGGVRENEDQFNLYKKGRELKEGKWVVVNKKILVTYTDGINKKSNHQRKADGYGHAFDIYIYIDGGASWDPDMLEEVAIYLKKRFLEEYDLILIWGGDWDNDGIRVDRDPDERFFDGAHFQLSRGYHVD